ncbi:MAG: Chalcone and stilbene synthase domain protein, partial [Verrucomicrobiales bacterium]|nr:Chalcone and stilbene synthase domain protein [Verrucomicrobiales bacterium]
VEVCSAAFYLDEDPGVLVSACLFGDGAAAAVISARDINPNYSVQWKKFGSVTDVKTRDLLRFEQKGGMLRNILSLQVPALAANYAHQVLKQVSGGDDPQFANYVLHAGGRDVLKALEKKFGLEETQTAESAEVLREFGNISSPFVLFVLQKALLHRRPPGLWWMASFGAGFSSHGAVLEIAYK